MKDKFDIGKYIAKAKLQELSKAEKQQLDEWLEADEKNKKLYSKLTNDDNIEQNLLKMQQVNVEKELRKVNSKIDKKRSKIRYMNILRVAATLVVPIVGYFLIQYYTPQEVVEPLTQIAPGSPKAILITAEGKELELETEVNVTLNIGSEVVVENKFNKLVYKTEFPNRKKRKEEVFNTLRTPLQGEYAVTLEDGTNPFYARERRGGLCFCDGRA
jgi:transmembrane sensor